MSRHFHVIVSPTGSLIPMYFAADSLITTPDESLAKCKEMREFLASYHLSPDEPDKLKNAISNAKAAGYDEKVLVDMIARFNSVNDETKRKQETIVQQEKRIKDQDETLEEQRVQILANAVERAAGDRLKWA